MIALAHITEDLDPDTAVVLLSVDADDVETEQWRGSFAAYVQANEYDAETAADIADNLIARGVHFDGGGAAELFALRISQGEGR